MQRWWLRTFWCFLNLFVTVALSRSPEISTQRAFNLEKLVKDMCISPNVKWRAILNQRLKLFYFQDYWAAILAPALLFSALILRSVDVIEPQLLRSSRNRVFISLIIYACKPSSGGGNSSCIIIFMSIWQLSVSFQTLNPLPSSLFHSTTKNILALNWNFNQVLTWNWFPAGLCLFVDVKLLKMVNKKTKTKSF